MMAQGIFGLSVRATLLAALSISAVMLSAPVFAQDTAAENDTGVQEIIVTAQRREESLQETPVSVSAFSGDDIINRQVGTTQDIQRLVPGLKLTDNVTSPTNFTVSLRGSTQQDASLVVAESPIGIYIDDLYYARLNGVNAQLADIERVEVLRGPQGTLYGRNTLAGAIKIVTITPNDTTRLRASASYGSDKDYRLSVAASGGLGDSVFASFAAIADGTDGYFTNLVGNGTVGKQRNYGIRGKLRLAPSDSPFEGELGVSYTDSSNDGYQPSFAIIPAGQVRTSQINFGLGSPYVLSIAPNPGLPVPIKPFPEGKTSVLSGSVKLSYDLGGATLKSITGYVKTQDFFSVEFTGVGAFAGANRSNTKQWSQELQLLGASEDEKLNYILGAYLFGEKADQVVALVTDDLLKIKTNSIAFFGQGSYKLTDKLSATAGARWTQDKKEFDGTIRTFVSNVPIFPTVSIDNTYKAFTPKFGLDYKIDGGEGDIDSLLLYANVARGFKSGGYNGIAFGNIDVLRTSYSPEKNWTYEVGFKSDAFNRKLRFNAAAFISNISDLALNSRASGPGGVSFPVQNAGDARIKGVEIEATVVPIKGLNIFGNITFQSGEYTTLNAGSNAAAAQLQFGKAVIPQLPNIAYNTGFSYEIPFNASGSTALSFGADWSHTNDFFIAVGNEIIIDGYDKLNAFAALKFADNWEIRGSVSNLLDDTDIISGVGAFSSVTVSPPRKFKASVSYSF